MLADRRDRTTPGLYQACLIVRMPYRYSFCLEKQIARSSGLLLCKTKRPEQWMNSILPWVCRSVDDHRRRQNVVRTLATSSLRCTPKWETFVNFMRSVNLQPNGKSHNEIMLLNTLLVCMCSDYAEGIVG